MISFQFKSFNIDFEMKYFEHKCLVLYKYSHYPVQVHMYNIEDVPNFPSTEEEVLNFIRKHFYRIPYE